MNKLSPRNLLVAAALFGIAAESAWSEEATPSEPAAAAEQTASPGTADVQGYAPTPNQRGYAQYWQQPPQWHEPPPPPGYGHFRPYYPPYPQYREVPAAPTENTLSAKLKQTGEQLSAKSTELNTANEQMATLQAEQQAIREVVQQAQAETAKASEQLSVVIEEMDILYEVLSGLKARLDLQNTSLLGTLQAGAAENDEVDSAVASDAEQAQPPATPSAQPGNVGSAQTEAGDSELTNPEAE
jgi:hypothetical protein